MGRSQGEAQVFWENQGKIVTCRRSGFFGTFHELATIMCITDQAFSKFSGSAEARKAEAEKAWVRWAGFSTAFCSDGSESGRSGPDGERDRMGLVGWIGGKLELWRFGE